MTTYSAEIKNFLLIITLEKKAKNELNSTIRPMNSTKKCNEIHK